MQVTYLSDETYEVELVEKEYYFLERSVIWMGLLLFGDQLDDGRSWVLAQLRHYLLPLGGILGAVIAKETDPNQIKTLIDRSMQGVLWRAWSELANPPTIPLGITKPRAFPSMVEHLAPLANECERFIEANLRCYSSLLARNAQSVPRSLAVSLLRDRAAAIVNDVQQRKWTVLFQSDYVPGFEAELAAQEWAAVVRSINLLHRDIELEIWSETYLESAPSSNFNSQVQKHSATRVVGLAHLIKECRASKCLSQERFAEEVGVSVRTVSSWEGGQKPRGSALIRLATVLDMSVQTLTSTISPKH